MARNQAALVPAEDDRIEGHQRNLANARMTHKSTASPRGISISSYQNNSNTMKIIDHASITKTAIDNHLNDLLIIWHRYRSGYSVGRGFSGRDATCRDFQTPTHWDWKNGALDGRVDAITAKAVSDAIDLIPNTPRRWNTALAFEARNLASRAAVWSSPVLPKDKEELAVLVLEARTMLLDRLRRAGVLT